MNSAKIAIAMAVITGAAGGAEVFLKDDKLVETVEKKVHNLQPTRQERRFDDVGWAPSIVAALAAARQHTRPVFLFTYDGQIETGRC